MQLLCAIAILVALGGVLATTPGGRDVALVGPADAAEAQLDPDRLAEISVAVTPRVARRVERIRELEFGRLPHPRVVDSEFLNQLSQRELERGAGVAGLGVDEAEARIVGVLGADEQLEDAYGTTGDLAAAAYDTRRDRLYVIGDAVTASPALIEFVIAHELNHALEDERFGLPEGGGATDDSVLAELALVEGSATALMIDYATRHIPPLELLEASVGLDSDTGDVPRFFVDQLLWTYTGGQRFIDELRRLGGGWKLVDYALGTRPPATTEQVIHPEKYIRDERALDVEVESRLLSDSGWRRVDRGVLGELTTAQVLAVGAPQAEANAAAAGWGGDAYGLWRRGASPRGCEHPCRRELVFVLDWAWDTPEEVGEFASAAATYVERGLDGTSLGKGRWKVDDGAVALRAGPSETALVFAPSAALAAAVAEQQLDQPERIAR